MKTQFAVYRDYPEYRARIKAVGGYKPVSGAMKMRAGLLANKLSAWAPLFEEERIKLEIALCRLEGKEILPAAKEKTGEDQKEEVQHEKV